MRNWVNRVQYSNRLTLFSKEQKSLQISDVMRYESKTKKVKKDELNQGQADREQQTRARSVA